MLPFADDKSLIKCVVTLELIFHIVYICQPLSYCLKKQIKKAAYKNNKKTSQFWPWLV